MDERLKQKRTEYNRPSFKNLLKENLGCECVNCGSTREIQYHHIVPLACGGTNKLSNIVPLCQACHKAAHNGRHITDYAKSSPEHMGRPRGISYEDAVPILDRYFDGKIGAKDCWERLGYKGVPKLSDKSVMKEYVKKNGIRSYRNNVDVKRMNGVLRPGDSVGYVYYMDGSKKELTYG